MGVSDSLLYQVGIDITTPPLALDNVTLWPSTDPDLLLYLRSAPTLTFDSMTGLPRLTLTLYREHQVGGVVTTPGGVLEATVDLNAAPTEAEAVAWLTTWSEARGGAQNSDGTGRLRLAPLPVRETAAELAPGSGWTQATTSLPGDAADSQLSLRMDIDSGPAVALEEGRSRLPSGGLALRQVALHVLPEVTAQIHVDGVRLFAALRDAASSGAGAVARLSWAQIAQVWQTAADAGAVSVTVGVLPLGATHHRARMTALLLNEALHQLFPVLFDGPYAADATAQEVPPASLVYAPRWRGPEDAEDQDFEMQVVGWTWLALRREVALSTLLATLPAAAPTYIQRETSFAASITVHGHPLLESVAFSWAPEGGLPQAPVFGPEGGTQTYLLSSLDPDAVRIRYTAKVNFRPATWPIIETGGVRTVAQGGNHLVLQPGAWISRVEVYLYRREGDEIRPLAPLKPSDNVVVNFTYTGPHLAYPIKASGRITPEAPFVITLPRDPAGRPGRATVSVMAVLDEQLLRSPEREVNLDAGPVHLLYDARGIEIVTSTTPVSESNRAAQRLLAARGYPVIRHPPARPP